MDTTESVIVAIKKQLKEDNLEITRESELDNIGLDSLDRIELMMSLETFYNIIFTKGDEQIWEEARTVDDCSKIIDDILLANVNLSPGQPIVTQVVEEKFFRDKPTEDVFSINEVEDFLVNKYSKEQLQAAFEAGVKRGYSGYPNTPNHTQPAFEVWFEKVILKK